MSNATHCGLEEDFVCMYVPLVVVCTCKYKRAMGEDCNSPRLGRPSVRKDRLYPDLQELDEDDSAYCYEESKGKRTPLKRRGSIKFETQKDFQPESADKVDSTQAVTVPGKASNLITWPVFTIVVIIAVMAGIFWSRSSLGGDIAEPADNRFRGKEMQEQFKKLLADLKSRFPSQTEDTWRSCHAAVSATLLHEHPRFPGVVAMIPLTNATKTTSCLADHLARIVVASYGDREFVVFNCSELSKSFNSDSDAIKRYMHDEIQAGLSGRRQHVVLFSNFDKIPAKSGMLLHGLCDTDNAPFKQAVYFLTSSNEIASEVAKEDIQLTTVWSEALSEDKRLSLETRIANNVVVVAAENSDDWFCPKF